MEKYSLIDSEDRALSELSAIVGVHNIDKISICGVSPREMKVYEMKHLLDVTETIRRRKQKTQLMLDQELLSELENLLGKGRLSSIDICGITPMRMDKEELESLHQLIHTMKLRSKGYQVMEDRFDLEGETIHVVFDYHPKIVEQMGTIPSASYKKPKKRWEVHVSQWPALEEVFRVTQPNIEIKYQQWMRKNKANRLKLTNQGCFLTGMDLPLQEIHMATSFPDQNAQHMAAFKSGAWDGRVALYESGSGFFPYGLLGRVLHVLKQMNVAYEFIDERVRPQRVHDFQKNVYLRDYQERTQARALEKGRGILQLATGAGKTKTASAIVAEYGLNTIFFVHTKFLLGQAKEALQEVLGTRVGQVGDGIVEIQPVTVAMVQTTIKALGGEYKPSDDDLEGESAQYEDTTDIRGKEQLIIDMLKSTELVFFDECQFVAAETFYTIANYCPAYYKFGLSATPYRSDKKDLMIEAALGPVIDKINASYLIKRGFLTRPKIHYFPVGRLKAGEERNYQQVYREEIAENAYRNQMIVESTKRLNAKNRSVLILVQQVNHGKLIQEMFRNSGMDVEFVYGDDNMDKRDLEVYKLRTKKKLALIATTIADEGLDVPSLDAVILGGGGKSPSKGMQRVGRAIRVFGDNEEAYEIFSSTKELIEMKKNTLIVVDDVDRGERLKEYFKSVNPSRNKAAIDIEFLHGDGFLRNKQEILGHLSNKDMLSLIVLAGEVSVDDIMGLTPLDAVLISGGEKIDSKSIEKTPKNVQRMRVSIEKVEVVKDEKSKIVEKLSETVNLDGIVGEIERKKSILFLVDESRYGKALKESLKDRGIQVQFLTGGKQSGKMVEKIQELGNGKGQVLIVNAQHLSEAVPLHLLDKVYVVYGENAPNHSLEVTQKDVRIFTKKDEAFVIDFIDNCKYLYNHSLERRMMFETEEEFVISGWAKQ